MELTRKQLIQEAQYSFPYHYSDLADGVYRLKDMPYLSRLEVIIDLMRPFTNQNVLDAGCGDGRLCYELRKYNVKPVGVDMSERAVSFARAFNPDTEFYVQELGYLKIPYLFDYIVLMETLEHILPGKIDLVLKNLSSHLKDDGKLIITVPSLNRPLESKHYQHFSKETLVQILHPEFDVVKIFGYELIGYRRGIFNYLNRLGLLLFPFSTRLQFVNRYYSFLHGFYSKNVGTGDPERCSGIVAVCMKVNH